MFFHNYSYLEEGMNITYEDIRQQRAQLNNLPKPAPSGSLSRWRQSALRLSFTDRR